VKGWRWAEAERTPLMTAGTTWVRQAAVVVTFITTLAYCDQVEASIILINQVRCGVIAK
jgi:hypothetical protein